MHYEESCSPYCCSIAAAMFAYAPIMIQRAPYEATMGLVQKIFYFHVPSWMVMFTSAFVCGIASAVGAVLQAARGADRLGVAAAELTVLFGMIGLITGPLWARKAWGVWWQWDARLTSSLVLWLIFVAYLLLRKYGGAGSEKLAAAVALFGMANVPFVYWSVNVWRTVHPDDQRRDPTLQPGDAAAVLVLRAARSCACTLLMLAGARAARERARAELEALYLAVED